jgi:rhodanese-related sulfurtransferase
MTHFAIKPLLFLMFTWSLSVAPAAAEEAAPATRPTTAPSRKITLEEFERARGGKDVVVLDVRSPREYAEGHVAGAVNIPVSGVPLKQFDESVGKLDKEKTYLVHCARGVRSANAVSRMEKLGFKHLLDFSGGMAEWQKAGKPVEKADRKP